MAFPTGAEIEIYGSPVKQSEARVKVRLDNPVASSNFLDEFSGTDVDTALWSYTRPAGGTIQVTGGELVLKGASTNAYPVVWAIPGKCFPLDTSIGWTLEWTMRFPAINGFGVFFRVVDLTNDAAIVAIKCNTADGLTVEMPDGTAVESLGADTGSHDFTLVYTPATGGNAATYELTRDAVSKKTMNVDDRQAWSIVIGNGSVQTSIGNWTQLNISRVDVNLTSAESQNWPGWTDREQVGSEWWGYLPWVSSLSMGFHERNQVDQCVITMPTEGYITGVGYHKDWFADYLWTNREVEIQVRHSDGDQWTSWKTVFLGLCDEPSVRQGQDGSSISITVRDKLRRLLQMSHLVRGYSDSADSIDGVVMRKTWPEIIVDQCVQSGLSATDYNVISSALKPRSWQIMGESAIDNIGQLADQGVAAVYINRTQANFGRLEVQEFDWGSDTPDFYASPEADIVGIDWAQTMLGLTAQVVVTVQHSEFGEFSDSYPRAPIPPTGAVIHTSASIAQTAGDINSTRKLPFLGWKRANRELNAVTVRMVGQDWLEVGMEASVLDRENLGIHDEYYVVIGADYNWTPDQGFLTTVYLANQHPEKAIMRASLAQAAVMLYPLNEDVAATATLSFSGVLTKKITKAEGGSLSFSGVLTKKIIKAEGGSLSFSGSLTVV